MTGHDASPRFVHISRLFPTVATLRVGGHGWRVVDLDLGFEFGSDVAVCEKGLVRSGKPWARRVERFADHNRRQRARR